MLFENKSRKFGLSYVRTHLCSHFSWKSRFVALGLFCAVFLIKLRLSANVLANIPRSQPSLSGSISKRIRLRPHIPVQSNCSDRKSVINTVHASASAQVYLHSFEFGRTHPCCLAAHTARPFSKFSDPSNILFIVKTTSNTQLRAALHSWALDVDHLLVVSHRTSSDLDSDSSSFRPKAPFKFHTLNQDPQFTSHAAMLKFIANSADSPSNTLLSFEDLETYREQSWFFLSDDETWVNVPAVAHLASQYDPNCPVMFGYVWNQPWPDQSDYISGAAGTLMSRAAMYQLVEGIQAGTCPGEEFDDALFGKCSWQTQIQLVHNRGFSFDSPDTSKDRREIVWLPPIAEAVSYHYVKANAMALMTEYSNSRWVFTPANNSNYTLVELSPAPKIEVTKVEHLIFDGKLEGV